jgi:hypothetical protein
VPAQFKDLIVGQHFLGPIGPRAHEFIKESYKMAKKVTWGTSYVFGPEEYVEPLNRVDMKMVIEEGRVNYESNNLQ